MEGSHLDASTAGNASGSRRGHGLTGDASVSSTGMATRDELVRVDVVDELEADAVDALFGLAVVDEVGVDVVAT